LKTIISHNVCIYPYIFTLLHETNKTLNINKNQTQNMDKKGARGFQWNFQFTRIDGCSPVKNEKRRVRGEGCYAGKDPADEGIVR